MWNGASGVGNQGGFRLNSAEPRRTCCGTGFALTNPGLGNGQSSREASTTVIEDTATWIKGKHNVTFGGSMVQADVWLQNQTLVPTVNFGLIASESANSIFSATNFPGASATDLQNATSLYAMLTGRIASIQGDARINPAGDAVRPARSFAGGRPHARVRLLRGRFMARHSECDRQRWRALRPGQPLLPGQQQLHDGDGRKSVRHLGRWQLVQAGDPDRYQASLRSVSRRHLRVQPGQEQPRAEWRIRLAVAGARQRLRAAPPRVRGRRQRDSWGGAMAFQRPGMSDFTGTFGANQGIRST